VSYSDDTAEHLFSGRPTMEELGAPRVEFKPPADEDEDMNLFMLKGTLATVPELRQFESGTELLRLLVTTKQTEPTRRTDVLPVVLWDPDDSHPARTATRGDRVLVVGALQRRFWESPDGRRSRIEGVAHAVIVS
jgi:single-strand DNA-binding protein